MLIRNLMVTLCFLVSAGNAWSAHAPDTGSPADTGSSTDTAATEGGDTGSSEKPVDSGYPGGDSGDTDSGWRPLDSGDTDVPDPFVELGSGATTEKGCGCASSPNLSQSMALIALLGLAGLARRRE